jgi:hypothetical protein
MNGASMLREARREPIVIDHLAHGPCYVHTALARGRLDKLTSEYLHQIGTFGFFELR